jgi:hypothetical protein
MTNDYYNHLLDARTEQSSSVILFRICVISTYEYYVLDISLDISNQIQTSVS